MSVVGVIFLILGLLVVWGAIGYVCGRICAEIIHKKDKDLNEVYWFWLGVIFNWIAIVLTLVVKQTNDKKE